MASNLSAKTIAVPLTWEKSSTKVTTFSIGAGVDEALVLPLDISDPNLVWDSTFLASGIAPVPPAQDLWATWDGSPTCNGPVYTRRFRASFTLPKEAFEHAILTARLYDPFKENVVPKGAIPLNDALYLYLNGQFVTKRSAVYSIDNQYYTQGYGTAGIDSFLDPNVAPESGGWFISAVQIGPEHLNLIDGLNHIDIVTEDVCGWGAVGFLALDLTLGSGGTEPTVTTHPVVPDEVHQSY
jgi:hypothetical protein